jgi:type IV pilus assembly protein PilE
MEQKNRSDSGFTLIELMIVVAIIAIISAIAFPSYQDSVRKSRRADAKAGLLELAQFMERTYTLNNTYVGAALPFVQTPKDTGTKFYDIAVNIPSANAFTLSATPIAGTPQAADKCGVLSLANTGVKTVSSSTVSECW